MGLKKTDQEKFLYNQLENLNLRTKSLVASAESKIKDCSEATASSLMTAILTLSNQSADCYTEWLTVAPDEKIARVQNEHNAIAMSCDNILVSLNAIAGDLRKSTPTTPIEAERPERLRKVDFRPFEKTNPKSWFEQLEVVFKSMVINGEDLRFGALLKLMDESTGTLLSNITRTKPSDPYSKARELLIREFTISKYDRLKAYILDSTPAPDERLTHFLARTDFLIEDVLIDDLRKFCVLRHAPPAVRLQLAGLDFDNKDVGELIKEADTL
ncbi:Hypothetical predicted protein, partial [Paramuricea clavata]